MEQKKHLYFLQAQYYEENYNFHKAILSYKNSIRDLISFKMKVVLIYRNNISLYSQIRSIYNPKKIIEMVNFIKADVNNPIRDPKAALNAFF